jgi:hypothetical protein
LYISNTEINSPAGRRRTVENNTPTLIPHAAMADLRRLLADLRGGELIVQEQEDDGCALIDERGVCLATTQWLSDARFFSACYQHAPGILARLEAAERQRDAYHAALSEIYYRAIPMNEDSGNSTIAHIAADAMRGKNGNPLAARDAQQRREGAAEVLGVMVLDGENYREDCQAAEAGAQALKAWAWVERTGCSVRPFGTGWAASFVGTVNGHRMYMSSSEPTPLAAVLDAMEKEGKG